MSQATLVCESPRLRLRHVEADDAPFILQLLNDPSWLRYIGDRGVRSLDDARRYIEDGPRQMYVKHGFGLFLVERRLDGAALGLCGLIRRDTLPDVDIGFALAPSYRGHGYAFEAAAVTLKHARETLRLRRIVAIARTDNTPSLRLLERLGLRYEREIRLTEAGEPLSYLGTSPAFAFDAASVHPVDELLWTSGQLSLGDIGQLPGLGFEAVVNLAPPTSSNALPGEAEAVSRLGLSYVQIPVPWEAPGTQHFEQFCGVMQGLAGRRVWVHCAKNMRVSAFVYLYRRLRRQEPDELARHPMDEVWEPDPVWRRFIDEQLAKLAAPTAG
ncbi:MAG: GNAT family N-acetyltransferase [Steroidobacteraceae bacterium]